MSGCSAGETTDGWRYPPPVGANASLSNRTIAVEPGTTATCEVRVRNTGSVVDQFDFTVVGDTDGWVTVEPPSLSLFPAAEGVAQVRISPPRDARVPAGRVPFGIKVASREDPPGSVVEEGTADVGVFQDLSAELVPRTSRGRRSAVHDLAVDNRGNATTEGTLSATDPDNALVFAFQPEVLAPPPGTATFSRVKVVARRRFLKGPPKTHPFQVQVESAGVPPIAVDGTMVQEPVIPAWAPKALLGLLMAAVALAVLWGALLKPQIKSAAIDAVAEAEEKNKAGGGSGGGGGGGSGGGGAGGGTTATTGGPTTTIGPVLPGDPRGVTVGDRLFLRKAGTVSFTVPEGKVFQLTDIVLQNPDANTGTLSVQRNGAPLLVVNLENFRDLDYHFVSPIVFTAGQKLELSAKCTSPTCTPGAYYSGTMTNA